MKSKQFIDEIKGFSATELKVKKIALKEELMKLRFKGVVNQLEKSHMIPEIKRNIARVETVLKTAK